MPMEEFTPDLSSLASDYQILTALRYGENSVTYLARNLKLNRDVTITAVRVPAGDNNTLTHFASDARTLAVMRHRNVVPVIEGRWLSNGTFAIIRARVRGSTLDQVVNSGGPMDLPRVTSTLEQVYTAVEWARSNGIVHRHVAAESIVFQQGSGRVLLELDPSPLGAGAMPDACDDARTVARLAYEMLTGQRETDPDARPLGEARPDLPTRTVAETEALMRCESGRGSRDAAALIGLLGGKVEHAPPAPAKIRAGSPSVVIPPGPLDSAVVVVRRPFGFIARVASAVVVLGVVGALGIVLMNRRNDGVQRTAQGVTTTSDAAGDVVLRTPPSNTSPVPAPTAAFVPSPVTTPAPTIVPETLPTRQRPIAPPVTRRPEPPITTPPLVAPAPTARVTRDSVRVDTTVPVVAPPDSVVRPIVPADPCDSIEPFAQQRCLSTAVERSDQPVSNAYERLISALRRQANALPNDPDPPSVDALRESQRSWTASRDAACRDSGAGPLYAKARAQCYSEQAAKRTQELLDRISNIP